MNAIIFDNFNRDNQYINYFIQIGDNQYIFTVRWSKYCKCAFLDIKDINGSPIITGRALVNNLKIRNNKLPYVMYFVHLNNETYEPTLDNISKEFALVYGE